MDLLRRGQRGMFRVVLGLSLAVGALAVPAALAQDKAEPAKPAEVQTLLVGERGVCDDLLVSDKDAALRKALDMLPARIRELHQQVPELREIPDEAVELILSILAHPMRVAITNKGFDEKTGMPGVGAVISIDMKAEGEPGAKAMHQRIETLRGMSQMPFEPAASKRFPGMTDLPLPMGVLSYGPRQAAGGWRYELIFAAIDDPDAPFAALPAAPEGVKPVVRGAVDLAAWSPIVSMFAGFAAMASPQGQQMLDQFREAGLVGPDAIKVEWVLGHSADQMQGMYAIRRLGKHAGAMTRATITDEDLSAIPADASYVSIAKFDVKKQWAQMRTQLQQALGGEFDRGLNEVKSVLGFDPETEIIASLGDTMTAYLADSTGGGSLLSGVVMMSLADPAKLSAAMQKAAVQANSALAREVEAPAAVEVARFERDGVHYTQLRFPGLPIPMEPTMAVCGNWLIMGVTPQATVAAARHASKAKPGGGLLASKAFSSARWSPSGAAGASAIQFVDSSRTLRDGFATLTFLGAAIENAARTRSDASPAREPGMVLPLYADLSDGARPLMLISYWQGDDFITDFKGDRSVLATLASVLGIGDVMPFIAGAITGGAIGASAAEQQQAEDYDFDKGGEDPDEAMSEEEPEHEDKPEKAPY